MENQYPIGEFEAKLFTDAVRVQSLAAIRFLPNALEAAITNLNEDQLHTPYREGGWTVHELVHHVADSHLNAYTRFKLALTEDNPVIKPYDENKWVLTDDVKNLPVNISITLLYALHHRWVAALEHLPLETFARTVFHPEQQRSLTLGDLLQSYAWHGKHHTAQINFLRQKNNW